MKSCRTCGEEKPLDAFHKNSRGAQGRNPDCAACRNLKLAERYANDPAYKRRLEDREIRKRFGITLNDYEAMFERQQGLCGICLRLEQARLHGRVKRLAVDHDHATGKVRALLCSSCNTALGGFADSPDRLRAAIAYLERHG